MNYSLLKNKSILLSVLAVGVIFVGKTQLNSQSVLDYPDLLPPQVDASIHSGAGDQTVAVPLTQQINGVEDMLFMNTVVNAQGANPDQATIHIKNRVQHLPAMNQDVVGSVIDTKAAQTGEK